MTVYHEILGVDPTATKAEIKSAYREQLQRYHPDKSTHPDAEDLFKDINQAKEGLIEGKRARKDDLYYEWDSGEPVEPLSEKAETTDQTGGSTNRTSDEKESSSTDQTSATGEGSDREGQQQQRNPQQKQQDEPAVSKSSRTRRAVIYGGAAIGGYWLLSNLADVVGNISQNGGSDSSAEQLDYGGIIKTPDGLQISVQNIEQADRLYRSVSERGGRIIPFEDYTGYKTESLGGIYHFITVEIENTSEEGQVVDEDLLGISSGQLIPQSEFIAEEDIIHSNTPYPNLTVNPGDTETALLLADIPFERPDEVYLTASFDGNSPDVELPIELPAGEAEFEIEAVDIPSNDELYAPEGFEEKLQVDISNTGSATGKFKLDIEWSDGRAMNEAAWPNKESTTIQPNETVTLTIEMGIDPIAGRDNPQPQYYVEGKMYDFYEN